jgi:hypothetical protein
MTPAASTNRFGITVIILTIRPAESTRDQPNWF